jgi:uncharacterized phage protein gp47/JayE
LPFARPSLGDLWNRIGALWRATFPGADTNLRNSPDRAFVGMIARSTDEDLSFLDWMVLQLFPFSAVAEYLERWAAWKNLQRKKATAGQGTIFFTGATPGETAVAGTQLQTSNGGTTVQLVADATAAGDGTVTATAVATAGGSLSNIGTGQVLTFVGTPSGFPDTGTVATAFAGGADPETDPQLRLRTARAYAQPSFGGNQHDWQNAALAVAGVTRAFTAPATPTPGAVTIYPLLDSIRANGIPVGTDAWFRPGTGPSAGTGGAGDQLVVLTALLGPRPICANLYVTALGSQAVNWTLANLVIGGGGDLATVKAAIAASIAALLLAKATPGGTIWREWIDNAIANTAGVVSYDLTVPSGDITPAAGSIAVPGAGTYV